MEKRYQIFISSTFRDLIEERQAALKAVLELNHIPAGMELFPAADDSAWRLICDVINTSDYYALIIGGRYGSLDATGLSYTHKEYQYAVSQGKPVIALLHKNPDNLPRDKTELDEAGWAKLQAFRKAVEGEHVCAYWVGADELKVRLMAGLIAAVARHPAVGWIRSDCAPMEKSTVAAGSDLTVQELFAGLVATATRTNRPAQAHPAFASVLSQLAPDEARILQAVGSKRGPLIAGVLINDVVGVIPMVEGTTVEVDVLALELGLGDRQRANVYLDNLARLGLINRRSEAYEVWSGRPLPGDPSKTNQDHVARWRHVRDYLSSYGVAEVQVALEQFEGLASSPDFKNATPSLGVSLKRRRPLFQLLLIWPSEFGKQMLKECVGAPILETTSTSSYLDDSDD